MLSDSAEPLSAATVDTGLQRLWRRLALPIDAIAAADVLVGLRPENARELLAVALASSEEADRLLDGLHIVLRSLSVSTTSMLMRCDGEIRGPVMWSATMAARSASPGAGGVFICASAAKAYDTDENRVLVAALHRVMRASQAAEAPSVGVHCPNPDDLRRARLNGDRARRALEHRSLQPVARMTPSGRMMQKARTGSKAPVFRTAVSLLQRVSTEVGAADLAPFVDDRAFADHALAADVLDVLRSRGVWEGRLRVDDGWLRGGAFAYGHHEREAAVRGGETSGVFVDDHPITALSDL